MSDVIDRPKAAPAAFGSFKKATRAGTERWLWIALSGPAGGGKTVSALRLATGLAAGRPIFLIDTDNQRSLQYVDQWDFYRADLAAPFSPKAYLEKAQEAEKHGCKVLIIDSGSPEHEDEGGMLDWHDKECLRMAGGGEPTYEQLDKYNFFAWGKPKAAHADFVRRLQRMQMHIIWTFRAKDKNIVKPDPEKPKKTIVEKLGWTPISHDRLDYAMTLSFLLPPRGNGRPMLSAESTKHDLLNFPWFSDMEQIGELHGQATRLWALGGKPREVMQDFERYYGAWKRGESVAPEAEAAPEATPTNAVPTTSKTVLALRKLRQDLPKVQTVVEYQALVGDEKKRAWLEKLQKEHPEWHADISALMERRYAALIAATPEARQGEGQ